ncbi:glycyl-radical activating family protein [Desulfosarcina alkanivorans]|uniref:Glycyl-radical activating family protein n=2 Tax=Desulfosarcina alkanivorans TaxID=571177 RepID=A0A5K7YLV4_9BACT|nr:glycyl-radical activating family protein [Desulfosarcina alkanivorans]
MEERCSGCGACIDVCEAGANRLNGASLEFDRDACVACGRCEKACPQNARERVGQDLTVEAVSRILERDAVFYRSSGGGVTFSGGEPFAQMEMLRRLARGCSLAGIRTAVETSGFFAFEDARAIFDWIDAIFIDLKHTNDAIHKRLTGVSNTTIIETIMRLDAMGRGLTVRIPLVRGLTDTRENIDGVIRLCRRLRHLVGIELLPYHPLGAGKYKGLGLSFDAAMTAPEHGAIQLILARMQAHRLPAGCPGLPFCPPEPG